MTVLLLLLIFNIAHEASTTSNTTDNTTTLLGKVRNFHEELGKMPGRIFDFELQLQGFNADNQDLVDQAAEVAKGIREKIIDVSNEVYNLELLVDGLEKKIKCGKWQLAMNLNPSDGHIMDYGTGWSDDSSIGSLELALSRDYLNQTVWNMPANYIAIVRHRRGVVDAVKVFVFALGELSLSHRFKKMDPGRDVVTSGGDIQNYTAPDARNLVDDPVFSVGGDLAFNWGFGNNGVRIVLTGGHLSDESDDNTHGLGNHFWINPKTGKGGSRAWAHEIANIQDYQSPGTVIVQGTDHGASSTYTTGPVYGNYAIYVSQDQTTFPIDGETLEVDINTC